ncbi:hypothetical protein N7449_003670 [Penicillium cf. viridicatum]|uniref:Uncharacterized protein n=1 Tax=Penicillium cf. viridicatum TaxID=2972119 RepID=A0A9W9MXC7_9EURO|nr:hypothetical protein N7449_003670 [Penicillium cf. viridicatum]
MLDSATKPQKRPLRSAGRRRLDVPGEAILSEKQVAFLEYKMKEIGNSLVDYRSSLKDTYCELLKDFDSILSLLTCSSEDVVQETSVNDILSRETSKKSIPQPP